MHLVESMDAGGGFLGDAADVPGDPVKAARVALEGFLDLGQYDGLLLAGGRNLEHGGVIFGLVPQVNQQRGIPAVVHDQVGAFAFAPVQYAVGVLPVLLEAFPLAGEHVRPGGGDGGRGMILGGVDVATGPADAGSEGLQRLDQHGGLHGHVQRAGYSGSLERLGRCIPLTDCHQARHFVFCKFDLLTPERRQSDISHHVVREALGRPRPTCRLLLSSGHDVLPVLVLFIPRPAEPRLYPSSPR
jgi:hypothetical protein